MNSRCAWPVNFAIRNRQLTGRSTDQANPQIAQGCIQTGPHLRRLLWHHHNRKAICNILIKTAMASTTALLSRVRQQFDGQFRPWAELMICNSLPTRRAAATMGRTEGQEDRRRRISTATMLFRMMN